MNGRPKITSVVRLAMFGAAFVMAFQVAGKAARDALFLSSYRPSQLPPMIMAGALSAITLGLINARLLSIFAPRQLVPWLLIASGGLHVVEWLTYHQAPGPTAIAVYIHVVALGAIITSGFWSVVNEQLDPYTSRQSFGTIAGAGTAGGVAGGFIAERLAVLAPAQSVLLPMTVAQIITGILLWLLPGSSTPLHRERVRTRDLLRRSSYLRQLSLLVLIGTFSAALLDYVLKANARHTLGPGEPLLRFFAIFHTGTAVLTFVFQTGATSALLNRFGLGAAISTLPAAVTGGGIVAATVGGLPLVVAARALESVIRGSFFRAGYELLYTPMLASEKRAIKSINDVTVDRLGDALGGGFAQMAIQLGPLLSGPVMLVTASATSGASWFLSRNLQKGYVGSLERSLAQHAVAEPVEHAPPHAAPPSRAVSMPVADRRQSLIATDRARKLEALDDPRPLERDLVPLVVPLLADPSLREPARRTLAAAAGANIGQLSDYLFDIEIDIDVRGELPPLLAAAGGARALDALLLGLEDPDPRIRTRCGEALDLLKQTSGIDVEAGRVYDLVKEELLSNSGRRPDLEHVAVLLSVVLPREPLRIAFEALNTDEPQLRGLALEYLETTLPNEVSEALLDVVDASPTPSYLRRSADVVREELTQSVRVKRPDNPD